MNVDLTPCGALGKIFYSMNQNFAVNKNLIDETKIFLMYKIPQN